MAGAVDAGELDDRSRRFHPSLNLLWVAIVEQKRLAQHLNSFLVAVKFVGLNRGQTVSEHALIVESVHLFRERLFNLLGLVTHQSRCGPGIR